MDVGTLPIDPDSEGFSGRIVRKLDDKGRVVLPAGSWRSHFAAGAKLTPWSGCLALWTLRSYRMACTYLRQQVRDGDIDPSVIEDFREDAVDVKADTQGRLQLPDDLRAEVGIDGAQGTEVLLSGQDDHVQVWNPQHRAERRRGRSPEMAQAAIERLRRY